MHWIERIETTGEVVPPVVVDLPAVDGPRHLVLTGPNGSGKTVFLEVVRQSLPSWRRRSDRLRAPSSSALGAAVLAWTRAPNAGDLKAGRTLALHLSAHRTAVFEKPDGFHALDLPATLPDSDHRAGHHFLKYLVNEQVQARLAEKDAPQEASRIFAWFDRFERALAVLFDLPELRLEFLRRDYDFQLRTPSRSIRFDQLPSGYASLLQILAELVLRVDGFDVDRAQVDGVVLIDEIDAFLHPALQERVLPFLTSMFPNVQFIVATHSPAVAVSLENATIIALGAGAVYDAADLAGTPYGQLLTTLFGISSDVDLRTTERLKRLAELNERRDSLGPAERTEMRELADDLTITNHPLVTEAQAWFLLASDGP